MFDMRDFDFDTQEGMDKAFKTYFEEISKDKEIINYLIRLTYVRCDYQKKELVLKIIPQKWMTNPYGIVHGGISATVLDTAMGVLCRYYSRGKMTPSISLNLTYLGMIKVDKPIYIVSHINKTGASINYASSYIYCDNPDVHLVEASGAYFVLNED